MPTYELALLLKSMPNPALATVLKRTASAIFDKGGIIRRIDNLGARAMPYKTSQHGAVHREASYFVMQFDAPPTSLNMLRDEYNRDIDIIRNRIFKCNEDEATECTIDEEMKPPPYRSEVIKLLEIIKKKEEKSKRFRYNTGLDYYPFQK